MSIEFHADKHLYKSVDILEKIDWISVTTLVDQFKEPFNAPLQAAKSARNKKSKWYGLSVEEITGAWEAKGTRATTLGTWYHGERETELLACETIERYGKPLKIFRPIVENGIKISPNQVLDEGIYPEHMVYLKTVGVCGQSDYAEVIDGFVNIDDYKTNEEIKKESYRNWEGVSKKMLSPLGHVDDCNFMHYALQFSTYMYIILKHNPTFSPGKQTIKHIIFEEIEEKDKYGDRIIRLDHNKNPIVKDVISIEVPYCKREVELMFDWLKNNRNNIRKKK